jgi:hypothetical protein
MKREKTSKKRKILLTEVKIKTNFGPCIIGFEKSGVVSFISHQSILPEAALFSLPTRLRPE